MQLSEDQTPGSYLVKQYVPGEIRINDQCYIQSIIISPHEIFPWDIDTYESIENNSLKAILNLNPDIVILGTGATQHFLNPKITAVLLERKIGVEVMDTHAACRTYNLLASEGRNVVAGLVIR
ncbi:MAG: hypothetical protein K0Q74_1211 [Gammaproteobacteria bacterium]|nr:hypothetical protein [Gammaproteobacteria bacterium]